MTLSKTAAFALLALGVVSSSLFVGVRSGRPAAGFRFFLMQCGLWAGLPTGALCAWLAQSFFETYGSGWPVLAYGAAGGALAGLVVALLLDFLSRRFTAWAATRFSSRRGWSESPNPALQRTDSGGSVRH